MLLPHRDSNPVKQNQNLVCYHYTMGHFCNWWNGANLVRAITPWGRELDNLTIYNLSIAGAKIRKYFDISKFLGKNIAKRSISGENIVVFANSKL